MTNASVKRLLIGKGINQLYHANTVSTACTFLEQNGLLSRGTVRDLGLLQTPQETDGSDQEYDVFYDIFFDSVDIHDRSRNINYYGPVTFVFSIDLLDTLPENCIKITKDNPKYWTSEMSEEEKYFLSIEELQLGFFRGNFKQHITLRHQYDAIPFDYLTCVILDDPGLYCNEYFVVARTILRELLDNYDAHIPLLIRNCSVSCNCKLKYESYSKRYMKSRFCPE